MLCLYEEDLERRRIVNRKTIASTLKRGFHGYFGAANNGDSPAGGCR